MKHFFESALEPRGIDVENGVVKGACVCQSGLIAKGHSLRTDRTLLNQLLISAKSKNDRVPMHLDHRSGAAGCIGTAQNFRLDGDKLRCDLHFFRTHDKFLSTMELLENLHESAGLSASFVGDSEGGAARCKDLLAVDIVIHPAAVANGLFSRRDVDFDALDENSDNPETENEEDNMNDMSEDQIGELLHEILDELESLRSENAQLREALGLQDEDDGEDNATDPDDSEPVLEETGARGGPNQYGALNLQTFDFESAIEENRRAGMDAKKAHVEALKSFARAKYSTLNL